MSEREREDGNEKDPPLGLGDTLLLFPNSSSAPDNGQHVPLACHPYMHLREVLLTFISLHPATFPNPPTWSPCLPTSDWDLRRPRPLGRPYSCSRLFWYTLDRRIEDGLDEDQDGTVSVVRAHLFRAQASEADRAGPISPRVVAAPQPA